MVSLEGSNLASRPESLAEAVALRLISAGPPYVAHVLIRRV